jgi:hypothetical protein
MRGIALLLFSTLAIAQAHKAEFSDKPVKDGPFTHLIDEPVRITVSRGTIYALGVWVASGPSSPPAGPSVSEIFCSHSTDTCHEQMANIVTIGDSFGLNPDSADYHVTRWTDDELLAENRDVQGPILAGECHLMGILKIDLSLKKVFAYQTLVEPVMPSNNPNKIIDSEGICKAANNTLWELRSDTMFSFSPDAKTVTYTPQRPK